MTTLFDLTYELASWLMPRWLSQATGGSATSLTDTAAAFTADQVGGTLWVLSTSKALPITSLTGTTQLNFASSTAIVAGNRYCVTCKDFNREAIRAAVNDALRTYAKRRTEDETLTVIDGQDAYTLPAGVRNGKEVWVEESTDHWTQLAGYWNEVGGELRWPEGFSPAWIGCTLRVVYRGTHTDLTSDSDVLPQDVDENLILWAAAVALARDGNMRFHSDPKRDLINKMNEALNNFSTWVKGWNEWQRDPHPAEF